MRRKECTRRFAAMTLTAALTLAAPWPARAADAGEADYRNAMNLAERGDLRSARSFFARAYAASPQWRYAFNASRTSALIGELTQAEAWLWRASHAALPGAERKKTQAEHALIEQQLLASAHGRLLVRTAAPQAGTVVQVDGEPIEAREEGWVAWVKAGRRAVRVDARHCAGAEQVAIVAPGERTSLTIEPCQPPAAPPSTPVAEVVAPSRPAPAPPPAPVPVAEPVPHTATDTVREPVPEAPHRRPAYLAGLGGLAAMVAGGALMGVASLASDDLNDRYRAGLLAQTDYRAERSTLATRYTLGGAALGLGAVGVALAVWWWPENDTAFWQVTPASLRMAWRF